MITCNNSSEISWNITILKETKDGYLVMAPNGETVWMSKKDYQLYLEKIN